MAAEPSSISTLNKLPGQWGAVQPWPIIPIHSVVMQNGKVLTFGTDTRGAQGGAMYHDIYDPVTKTHQTLDHTMHTPTDVFCSAAIILPGTDKILIAGGDARPFGRPNGSVNDSNYFSTSTQQIMTSPEGAMAVPRWYNTMLSLPTGQVVTLGGREGRGVAEIFTQGEGWRTLPGAADPEMEKGWWYPRAWVAGNGEIVYIGTDSTSNKLTALDPSGNGSIRQIGTVPFQMQDKAPATMYEAGKVLMMAADGVLWTMDITTATPVFTRIGLADQDREDGSMTIMADGKVLITGGTARDNREAHAIKDASIWDPQTGLLTKAPAEEFPRMYHSTAVLLPDGTVFSGGGGAADYAEKNYLNGQIYKPAYLLDANGNDAVRPVILEAPSKVVPGQTFTIKVDNADAITKLTFLKNGAATHAFNMDARAVPVEFVKNADNTISVTLPANPNDVTAGSWMLFAWNDKGVPSVAPILAVQPTLPAFDGLGDLNATYFTVDPNAVSLDAVNFEADPVYKDSVVQVDAGGDKGFYNGAPGADFAVSYKGAFDAAKSGQYTFFVTSDDAVRLFIDGTAVIRRDGVNSNDTLTLKVDLTAGKHQIELRYLNAEGNARLDLEWAGPDFSRKQMSFDAQEHNLLVNGSLESFEVGEGWKLVDKINGWSSSARPEIWKSGYNGVAATSNATLVQVDAGTGPLWQDVVTKAGKLYSLSFDIAAAQGNVATSKLDVVINGKIVKTITPEATGWKRETIEFTGSGTDKVEFRSPAGDYDNDGALIDTVKLVEASPDKPGDKPVDKPADKPVDDNDHSQHQSGTTKPAPDTTKPVTGELLVNGSLESSEVGDGWKLVDKIDGWNSEKRPEIWGSGYNGVTVTSGKTLVQVDYGTGPLWQDVATKAGKLYSLSFDIAAVQGPAQGNVATSKLDVVINGKIVKTITPEATGWKRETVEFTGSGTDKVEFRSPAGDYDNDGALIDTVKLAEASPDKPGDKPVDKPADKPVDDNDHSQHQSGTTKPSPSDPVKPAEKPVNLLVNGDVEQMIQPDGWQSHANGHLPGWKNGGGNTVEVLRTNGNQVMDLDSTGSVDTLYQDVATQLGKVYKLSFSAFGVSGTSDVEVMWDGKVVGTVKAGADAQTYNFDVVGTGGPVRLEFREPAVQNSNDGARLDNIVLQDSSPIQTGQETGKSAALQVKALQDGDVDISAMMFKTELKAASLPPVTSAEVRDRGDVALPKIQLAAKTPEAFGAPSTAIDSSIEMSKIPDAKSVIAIYQNEATDAGLKGLNADDNAYHTAHDDYNVSLNHDTA